MTNIRLIDENDTLRASPEGAGYNLQEAHPGRAGAACGQVQPIARGVWSEIKDRVDWSCGQTLRERASTGERGWPTS